MTFAPISQRRKNQKKFKNHMILLFLERENCECRDHVNFVIFDYFPFQRNVTYIKLLYYILLLICHTIHSSTHIHLITIYVYAIHTKHLLYSLFLQYINMPYLAHTLTPYYKLIHQSYKYMCIFLFYSSHRNICILFLKTYPSLLPLYLIYL